MWFVIDKQKTPSAEKNRNKTFSSKLNLQSFVKILYFPECEYM